MIGILYGQAPLRQMALYVQDNPGTNTAESRWHWRKPPERSEHLATLRDHDLVERHRFRRRVEHQPTDTLEAWADEVGECYWRP